MMLKVGGPAMSRRRMLQVTGAGVTMMGMGGLIRPAMAEPYSRPFTWISPRGTLEVLDDYGFWIGKKMGYFGDLAVDMQPGP